MHELPNDATGDALRLLLEHGSDLSQPMDMDFYIAVPSAAAGEQIAAAARTEGFATVVEQDEDSGEWLCCCSKTLVPDYATVAGIEQWLDGIARPHGGHSDGFGSYGNAPDEAGHDHHH